jgi:ABC-type nitrate/sulfonate/bicarbonate transport system substrate-binding protein
MHTPKSAAITPEFLGRRRFLSTALGGAAALAGTGMLAACGSSSSSAATASGGLANVSLQFNYLKNVQFAGSFMADHLGYYRKNGLNVSLLAGGPNLAVEPVVESGKALVGITHTAEAVNAIVNGADLKIIGAGYQKNPFCLVSTAAKPINTPRDMIGKKIGISTTNQPIWQAFLKANNISPSSINVVTIQFDPTPLATGEVDGFMAFYTNEPIILELKGIAVKTFLFNDFGYPLLEDVYITKGSSLSNSTTHKQVVELMRSEAQGWQAAVADPNAAATLAVTTYGKDLKLDPTQQKRDATAQNALVVSADTKAHGLFWMSATNIADTVHSLALGGSKATTSMFTTSVLQEVYQGKATV